MFKQHKKNRDKYRHQLKIISWIIVRDKAATKIPVERRTRDRGGLYCMPQVYLPVLQLLDDALRAELMKVCSTIRGANTAKVCMQIPIHFTIYMYMYFLFIILLSNPNFVMIQSTLCIKHHVD